MISFRGLPNGWSDGARLIYVAESVFSGETSPMPSCCQSLNNFGRKSRSPSGPVKKSQTSVNLGNFHIERIYSSSDLMSFCKIGFNFVNF